MMIAGGKSQNAKRKPFIGDLQSASGQSRSDIRSPASAIGWRVPRQHILAAFAVQQIVLFVSAPLIAPFKEYSSRRPN